MTGCTLWAEEPIEAALPTGLIRVGKLVRFCKFDQIFSRCNVILLGVISMSRPNNFEASPGVILLGVISMSHPNNCEARPEVYRRIGCQGDLLARPQLHGDGWKRLWRRREDAHV
jgi:hypothetical protein